MHSSGMKQLRRNLVRFVAHDHILCSMSPIEFEMALYSLYFLAGSERNNVFIDGYEICIRAYRINSKYGDKVQSQDHSTAIHKQLSDPLGCMTLFPSCRSALAFLS